MAEDIVNRLRNWHTDHDSAFPRPIDLEAADEIERLRADVMYWKALPYCPKCGCGTCQDNEQVLNNE
jgi:hypothetical protein